MLNTFSLSCVSFVLKFVDSRCLFNRQEFFFEFSDPSSLEQLIELALVADIIILDGPVTV